MILRKQTVWLLTMLAVMVVLSGYYLVKGPNEQIPALGEETKQVEPLMGVEVNTKGTDQPAPEATPVEAKGTVVTEVSPKAATDVPSGSDYFTGYKMKREAMQQKQKDEQMEIMTSSDATPQAVADARVKYDKLSTIETQIVALEELLKAQGYKDAVVNAEDDRVQVVVQKDKLDEKEVVEIIALVKQQMKVSGQDVKVRYQQ